MINRKPKTPVIEMEIGDLGEHWYRYTMHGSQYHVIDHHEGEIELWTEIIGDKRGPTMRAFESYEELAKVSKTLERLVVLIQFNRGDYHGKTMPEQAQQNELQ